MIGIIFIYASFSVYTLILLSLEEKPNPTEDKIEINYENKNKASCYDIIIINNTITYIEGNNSETYENMSDEYIEEIKALIKLDKSINENSLNYDYKK